MLTQRKTDLLKTVVGEYIGSASPVASETVAKKHSPGLSSATVRNEMAHLEFEGYITRPHHSAGAVPSDKGYRFYVETLSQWEELPSESQHTVRYQFTRAGRDIDGWTRLAATALAQLVNNAALVTYPREPESRLIRVNLVQIQESLAFLIVVLQEVKLRKQLVPLTEPLTSDDLQMMGNRLNDSFSGLSRREILSKPMDVSPLQRTVTDMILDIMETEDRALYNDHYVEGLQHLLSQPEFSEGSKAREMVEVLEDKELPKMVLAEAPEWGHMKVIIGGENRVTFLHPLSMIVCQYGLPGGGLGSISALGPTRMEYSRTIAGVRFIASLMTDLMAQVHG
ncbi:heat-inducible transcription repressor HrcA [SAR202 cluster bacterium AC-647-N09_OGT_505m]|nr:heat-inducible transcription repressor HrcA [SAR202 cluster bacterium AC-647-N09_OGT_505m]